VFTQSSFSIFRDAVASGGVVRGFAIPGAATSSRKEIEDLVAQAKQLGASGLVWIRRSADGVLQSSALKAAGEATLAAALDRAGAQREDLLVLAAGQAPGVSKMLGQLRLNVARARGLLKADEFAFLWVVDFPLLEWNEEDGRWFSMHHPFTSPVDEDVPFLASDPGRVRAKAYDLVLNGSEIAGGSIRIHDTALQRRIFTEVLGIGDEEARARFGFFLEALEYGTPPHGGIAFGLDRIVAILAGEQSIREVMAFPKTAQAVDLMSGAPSPVDPKQLRELHLKTQG
jgi:aspartyl-tRNA synthetase